MTTTATRSIKEIRAEIIADAFEAMNRGEITWGEFIKARDFAAKI